MNSENLANDVLRAYADLSKQLKSEYGNQQWKALLMYRGNDPHTDVEREIRLTVQPSPQDLRRLNQLNKGYFYVAIVGTVQELPMAHLDSLRGTSLQLAAQEYRDILKHIGAQKGYDKRELFVPIYSSHSR